MMINIGICCNDEYGQTDLLTAIHISDGHGEEILDLRSDFNVGETISIINNKTQMRVNNGTYRIHGYGAWVGNIYWDAVTMELEDAAKLINDLLALDHWCVFGAEFELAQAIESERYITDQQLEAALS